MKIEFFDTKAQFSEIQEEITEGILEVIENDEFILGNAVSEFEREFSDFIFNKQDQAPEEDLEDAIDLLVEQRYNANQNHCVGVANGTDALEIAIKALDLPPKSEIIIPANTHFACVEAVLNAGFNAVIADCDENGKFVPKDEMVSKDTRAVMAGHLYGQILDLETFECFCKKHNLKLIENCSHAHGGLDSKGRAVGSVGDVSYFSFYPTKNLGAFGDAGAIVSKDLKTAIKAREIANHGQRFLDSVWQKNRHEIIGQNSRLDSIQARVLQIKLKNLEQHNEYRERCARTYYERLSQFSFLKLPYDLKNSSQNVWHLFVVESKGIAQNKRDELISFLLDNGIECGIHYPHALSEIEVLQKDSRVRILPTPNASKRAKNIFSLPIGEHLSIEHIDYIAEVFAKWEELQK